MQTGILRSPARKAAWQLLSGESNACSWVQDTSSAKNFEVFIDLDFDMHPERILDYSGNTNTIFLLSAVCLTPEMAFHQMGRKYSGEKIFGINALPTFLERNTLELSNPFDLETSIFPDFSWWTALEWVKSRVGMVTPRVVFMIINEAYYTLQEGTASKKDINEAMKLGTNYPKGPFEWCEATGIDNVYATLTAVFDDTGDERYRICPELKSEWLKSKIL